MASTSGLQNNPTNNLNTIDGLQILNATSIYDNGQLIDPTAYVPYNGATSDTNLGTYKISSSTAPTTGNNLTNKTYVDGAVSIGSGDTLGIVNLNFVRYSGSISNTDLGTYTISSSTAPSTGNNLTNKTYVDTQDALRVPYTGATASVNLGSNTITASTAKFTAITSAAPSLALGVDALGNLNTFAVPSGASFPFGGTTNINGALKTILEPLKYNSTMDAYAMTAVLPSTYTLVSGNWRIVNSSGTVSEIQFSAPTVFQPFVKYIITFTNMSCGSGTYSGTVYNTSTSLTISDSPIAITTTPQTLIMTFTTSSTNATINLRFTGTTNVYIQFTNFTIQQASTEIIGNMLLDSEISSNITQSMGKTANFSGGLLVNQTSTGVTAATFTTASLPAGAPASTLSGTYTLAPNPTTGASFAMWFGAGTSFITGAKYNFTFTGMSGTQTNQQVIYMYVNSYSGGVATNIGDIYYYWIPPTGSAGTVTGSFTATANSIVFQFQASVISKNVSFSTFTLTRADVALTGVTTISGTTNISGVITATGIATGTPATTIGLNSSNQLIKYVNPTIPTNTITGTMTTNYIPITTGTYTLGDSTISQNSTGVGIGEPNPVAAFQVRGTGSVCGGTNYANTNNYMAMGSLTLGASNKNYGGGTSGWNGNTAALLFECLDNTEIAVHDAGDRVASLSYYAGNMITMGRNMGWGNTNTRVAGKLNVGSETINTNGQLNIDNVNGGYANTHFNWPDGYNYIRGARTWFDHRYINQYYGIDGDVAMILQNVTNGTNAYMNLIIGSSAGNTNHFMNATARVADGGYACYTIRNDSGGGIRFLTSNGAGFSSYISSPNGGTYMNSISQSLNTTAGNVGTWNSQGYTLFCNTSTPAGSTPALALGCSNTGSGTNYIVSLQPGVQWTPLGLYNAYTIFTTNGSVCGYTVASGGSNVSDLREKYDIKDLKTARSLERVLKCRPKSYKRIHYDKNAKGEDVTPAPQSQKDLIHIGLIAQEVKDYNPHCISTWENEMIPKSDDDDGMRFGVNYGDFTIHLIGAVQEQQKQINDLRDFTQKQNDVIKKLIDKQETLEQTIVSQNNLLQEIINRLKK
jgi:hypothetical protein